MEQQNLLDFFPQDKTLTIFSNVTSTASIDFLKFFFY